MNIIYVNCQMSYVICYETRLSQHVINERCNPPPFLVSFCKHSFSSMSDLTYITNVMSM